MKDVLLILIVGGVNLLSFYLGMKKTIIEKAEKQDKEKFVAKKRKMTKEEKKEQEEFIKEQELIEANLENIEAYDGTSAGQKIIPN